MTMLSTDDTRVPRESRGSAAAGASDTDRRFEQLLRLGACPVVRDRGGRMRDPFGAAGTPPPPGHDDGDDGDDDPGASGDESGSQAGETPLAPDGGAVPERLRAGPAAGRETAARSGGNPLTGSAGRAGEPTDEVRPGRLGGDATSVGTSRPSGIDASPRIQPGQQATTSNFDFGAMAERIATMFRSTPGGTESWRVELELAPDLPQTKLRIHASRTWIAIRFSTHSASEAQLLSKHMSTLEEQLEESLDMRHQVDVGLE